VLLMGGILGRLLHEFAVTIIVAVLLSGFVSLTLTPLLCSRMLKVERKEDHGRIFAANERAFQAVLGAYGRSLHWALRHRRFTMLVFTAIFAGTGFLFSWMPKGFLPSDDVGQLFVITEAAQDISFDAMKNLQQQVAEIIQRNPHVENVMSFAGAGGPSSSLNNGRVFVTLKPRGERPSADAIVQELRPALTHIPGVNAYVQNIPTIRVGGRLSKSEYQYTVQAPDTAELYRWAPQIEAKLRALPVLANVTSDLQITQPQVTVDIDRNRASALGVSAQAIESTLYDAYGARQVSTIFAPTNQYWVVMELEPRYQTDPSVLSLLYVRSSTGALVPLNAVATLKPDQSARSRSITGAAASRSRSRSILRPGVALSQAIERSTRRRPRDAASATLIERSRERRRRSRRRCEGMGILLALAVFIIYLVLGILYESFIHPLTILSGPADCRLRRARHADRIRQRPQHVRVRRHHHADRHRQEERDPDDRLRDRGRSVRRQICRGRDLPGVHHALPSDHDDDDGRADGKPADRARARRRAAIARAARPRRRRRARRVADADALHHAGRLPLLRALRGWRASVAKPAPVPAHASADEAAASPKSGRQTTSAAAARG
jgi:HAE1 family hydrophobic/amphiphilic exporter-1